MISTLLTMSRFLQFAVGVSKGGAECGGVGCTVATPGQRHLHANCTYMVVLQIHQESVHDLFSTKCHRFFLKPYLYIYIFIYIPPKKREKNTFPLTTLKV